MLLITRSLLISLLYAPIPHQVLLYLICTIYCMFTNIFSLEILFVKKKNVTNIVTKNKQLVCSESSQLNTLFVIYSMQYIHNQVFFSPRRLTTKHLKGTHRTDSRDSTIWQKLSSQFQVRPTTNSTRTSQLGRQAYTATDYYFSTNSTTLKMHQTQ